MTELPPARPGYGKHTRTFQITSYRIMAVFSDISEAMIGQAGISYARVWELDSALTEADRQIPAILRPKPLFEALIDPIGLILQRYLLQIRVSRARCILHRRWLKAGMIDKRFARSRWVCVEAAVQLLQIQFQLDAEMQPGGRLFKARWVLARCLSDFLLGDMILCLELSHLDNGIGGSQARLFRRTRFWTSCR